MSAAGSTLFARARSLPRALRVPPIAGRPVADEASCHRLAETLVAEWITATRERNAVA